MVANKNINKLRKLILFKVKTLSSMFAANLTATSAICFANSRVGATIKPNKLCEGI